MPRSLQSYRRTSVDCSKNSNHLCDMLWATLRKRRLETHMHSRSLIRVFTVRSQNLKILHNLIMKGEASNFGYNDDSDQTAR